MKNTYMLITVVERTIATEQFTTFRKAWDTMVRELGEDIVKHTEMTQQEWEEVCEQNDYFGTEKFEYGKFSAWSNLDEEYKKDWLIVGLD